MRLTNVSKRFGGVVAVKDISFSAVPAKSTRSWARTAREIDPDGHRIGRRAAGRRHYRDLRGDDRKARAAQAQHLGLAIVHQHPAVLPELTVAENMLLAVPADLRRGGGAEWVATQLRHVGSTVDPRTRMSEVDIAQRQLYELAKALAIEPKVLILDEPTAALTADLVELLFEKVRAAAARGAAVIYISHRLQEIRQIADRVTVMRDGEIGVPRRSRFRTRRSSA